MEILQTREEMIYLEDIKQLRINFIELSKKSKVHENCLGSTIDQLEEAYKLEIDKYKNFIGVKTSKGVIKSFEYFSIDFVSPVCIVANRNKDALLLFKYLEI